MTLLELGVFPKSPWEGKEKGKRKVGREMQIFAVVLSFCFSVLLYLVVFVAGSDRRPPAPYPSPPSRDRGGKEKWNENARRGKGKVKGKRRANKKGKGKGNGNPSVF